MGLKEFLTAVLSGSIAVGPVVYLAMEKIPQFAALDAEVKRWVVALLAGLLGVGAWAAALGLGYVPAPDVYTPNFFAESIWTYGVLTGFAAFTSATLIHGHLALSKMNVQLTQDGE